MNSFCMNCGIELPEGASFCPKCGTKVEILCCPACGKEIDYGMDFCIYCGNSLTTQNDEPSTPIHLPGPEPHPEVSTETFSPEVQSKVPAEDSAPSIEPATPSKQDLPSEPPQAGERIHNDDDVQQFAWSYIRMGALGVRRYDITSALTAETLHINEQKRFVGWKPTSSETDVALTDIQQVHIRSKASFLYWGLFAALVTLGVIAFVVGILNSTACVLLTLFVAGYAWLGSFQLLHNEIVIVDHSGKETVLKGGKKEVFQKLEQGIAGRTGAQVKAPSSATAVIILSVALGVIGAFAGLWILSDRSTALINTQQPSSESQKLDDRFYTDMDDSLPIAPKDLIGCWQFRYTEFNTGETVSYRDVEDEFLRFYADNSYTYTGHIWGNWYIQNNTAALHDMAGAYKGNPRIIYLKDGMLYLKTSEKTSQFEKLSDQPDYEVDSSNAEQSANLDPSAGVRPDDNISEALFSQIPNTFYFMNGVGVWQTTLWLNSDGTFVGSFFDNDMGDMDPDQYPNGTMYLCDFYGVFTEPERIDEYTYSVKVWSIHYADPGVETYGNGFRYISATPYGLEDADEMTICLPGYPVENLSENITSWLRMTEFSDDVPEKLPFCLLINENENLPFVS